jgi:heat shock protein HslJ
MEVLMKRSKTWMGVALLPLMLGACQGQPGGPLGASPQPGTGGGSGQTTGQAVLALVGSWKLTRLEKTGESPVQVASPERFVASFGGDGRVNLLADCNRCSSSYEATAATISIGAMACTRAACASAPLDTDFAGLVSGATSWEVSGSQLTLRSSQGRLLLEH